MRDIAADVVGDYAVDVAALMGCHGDASMGECSPEWDSEREVVLIDVPNDADPTTFCDLLAQMLCRAGYADWDVWLEPGIDRIAVGDKEFYEWLQKRIDERYQRNT